MTTDDIIRMARKGAGMKRKKIDELWFEAMHQSIADGEDFIRYHFAALVAAAEREACAKVCERLPAQQEIDVRDQCAAAIRERGKNANRKTNPEIRGFEDNEYNTE